MLVDFEEEEGLVLHEVVAILVEVVQKTVNADEVIVTGQVEDLTMRVLIKLISELILVTVTY